MNLTRMFRVNTHTARLALGTRGIASNPCTHKLSQRNNRSFMSTLALQSPNMCTRCFTLKRTRVVSCAQTLEMSSSGRLRPASLQQWPYSLSASTPQPKALHVNTNGHRIPTPIRSLHLAHSRSLTRSTHKFSHNKHPSMVIPFSTDIFGQLNTLA